MNKIIKIKFGMPFRKPNFACFPHELDTKRRNFDCFLKKQDSGSASHLQVLRRGPSAFLHLLQDKRGSWCGGRHGSPPARWSSRVHRQLWHWLGTRQLPWSRRTWVEPDNVRGSTRLARYIISWALQRLSNALEPSADFHSQLKCAVLQNLVKRSPLQF